MSAPLTHELEDGRSANAGWIAAGLIILAVFVVGAAFWFKYHP